MNDFNNLPSLLVFPFYPPIWFYQCSTIIPVYHKTYRPWLKLQTAIKAVFHPSKLFSIMFLLKSFRFCLELFVSFSFLGSKPRNLYLKVHLSSWSSATFQIMGRSQSLLIIYYFIQMNDTNIPICHPFWQTLFFRSSDFLNKILFLFKTYRR